MRKPWYWNRYPSHVRREPDGEPVGMVKPAPKRWVIWVVDNVFVFVGLVLLYWSHSAHSVLWWAMIGFGWIITAGSAAATTEWKWRDRTRAVVGWWVYESSKPRSQVIIELLDDKGGSVSVVGTSTNNMETVVIKAPSKQVTVTGIRFTWWGQEIVADLASPVILSPGEVMTVHGNKLVQII